MITPRHQKDELHIALTAIAKSPKPQLVDNVLTSYSEEKWLIKVGKLSSLYCACEMQITSCL
jgi:hypothetical protein